jgi:hypothetical protein
VRSDSTLPEAQSGSKFDRVKYPDVVVAAIRPQYHLQSLQLWWLSRPSELLGFHHAIVHVSAPEQLLWVLIRRWKRTESKIHGESRLVTNALLWCDSCS